MRLEEVRRVVTEITSNDLSENKLWYSLKYDQKMLMVVERGCKCEDSFRGR